MRLAVKYSTINIVNMCQVFQGMQKVAAKICSNKEGVYQGKSSFIYNNSNISYNKKLYKHNYTRSYGKEERVLNNWEPLQTDNL